MSAETMKEMPRRATADVERGRLEEMAYRRGGDAGPAGMFARSNCANPETLRKYMEQVFGDVESKNGGRSYTEFAERVKHWQVGDGY